MKTIEDCKHFKTGAMGEILAPLKSMGVLPLTSVRLGFHPICLYILKSAYHNGPRSELGHLDTIAIQNNKNKIFRPTVYESANTLVKS